MKNRQNLLLPSFELCALPGWLNVGRWFPGVNAPQALLQPEQEAVFDDLLHAEKQLSVGLHELVSYQDGTRPRRSIGLR